MTYPGFKVLRAVRRFSLPGDGSVTRRDGVSSQVSFVRARVCSRVCAWRDVRVYYQGLGEGLFAMPAERARFQLVFVVARAATSNHERLRKVDENWL